LQNNTKTSYAVDSCLHLDFAPSEFVLLPRNTRGQPSGSCQSHGYVKQSLTFFSVFNIAIFLYIL